MKGTFRSLSNFNYRVWAAGAIVSNVGTWMQRTAQHWVVLTQLTYNSATAVGVVMALQFGPQLLLLPLTGLAADRYDRRTLLMVTQACMGGLALGLGILTLGGLLELRHLYLFALLFGCMTAFDSPARQTFVSDLVTEGDLPNAVALNSISMNIARIVGPAIAGIVIACIGSGWAFVLNGASFLAVLCSLSLMRVGQLHRTARPVQTDGQFLEGVRYVGRRADLRAILLMFALIGTFGLNFPIFLTTMSVTVFHADAGRYGILMSTMALGSITGALLAAARTRPNIPLLFGAALLFGCGCALAALMPNVGLFGLTLVIIGLSTQTFTTSSNSLVQLSSAPVMRGRVMAILLAIALGGTPIGAPIAGWVADRFGPRWSLGLGAASGFAAAIVAIHYLVKYRQLSVRLVAGRVRCRMDPPSD